MSESTLRLSAEIVEVLDRAFDSDRRVVALFQQFFTRVTYSGSFALSLIDVAQGKRGDSWEVRRLATLMLQEHLLSLPASNTPEFKIVLENLGLEVASDGKVPLGVLKEGYSCRDLPRFVREFRRRLARPRSAVRPRSSKRITTANVWEFAQQSRQECKLALARYMFHAEEVVARVYQHVQRSAGIHIASNDLLWQDETDRLTETLPEYEAAILRMFQSTSKVYWVASATSSELNSLVEYPVGTVVLVVKPPGSHFEFELKRVGRRGAHPLSVRSHVPVSHRLDGGSMLSALRWDAQSTAVLNRLYRHVHDAPAPISRIVQILAKFDVPMGDRQDPILEYLTHRANYGAGYDEMRKAMAIVVDCFRAEQGDVVPPFPGEYGLTAQFLAFADPAQATVCGSSSFRLDLLAKYLSPDGPDQYFRRGLEIEHEDFDAKRLADDVLDEVLGVYHPPDVQYQHHDQYVAAALAVPRNRARANAVYLSLLRQIGTMWGTVLGLRGYSFGESFVSRNVGLRTMWRQGKWCVRLIFQDHDNLVLPDKSQTEFWPMTALPPTVLDDLYINGRDGRDNPEYELDSLRRIYRVDEAVEQTGRKRLRGAMKYGYAKTQFAMMSDPWVKASFHERFVERLRDWDAIARIYLARTGSADANDRKKRVERFLKKRGYDNGSIADHCRALEAHESFVETYSFLYRTRSPAPRTKGIPRDGVARSRGQSPSP
jgi:hypothetical protein